jgi:hypothetical protein
MREAQDISVYAVARGVEDGVPWCLVPHPRNEGAYNGYAQLPPRLRALPVNWDRYVHVHGGLTYGPDASGWIGFDTGHFGDVWNAADLSHAPEIGVTYWSWNRVSEETRRLAAQVAALADLIAVVERPPARRRRPRRWVLVPAEDRDG